MKALVTLTLAFGSIVALNAAPVATLGAVGNCTGNTGGSLLTDFGPGSPAGANWTGVTLGVPAVSNAVTGTNPGCGGNYLALTSLATTTASASFSGNPLNYVGFYWATPDSTNSVTITTTAGSFMFNTSNLSFSGGTANPGSNGDSGQFVNFKVSGSEAITGISFTNTSNTGQLVFEADNVYGSSVTPEPSTFAMFGAIGAALVVGRLRRRS